MSFRGNRRGGRRPFQRRPQGPKKPQFQHTVQLLEPDVGISRFISPLEGFSGVIKARFSDFQVNEIAPNGEVAKLTDQTCPEFKLASDDYKSELQTSATTPIEDIPQSTWEGIKALLEGPHDQVVELDVSTCTKEDRTRIHNCCKGVFGTKIIAKTVDKDEKKMMEFKRTVKGEEDKRSFWPPDLGEYVHFLVYKESMDTLEVTMKISDSVGTQPANFAYAGVKDKRAKTTQWFSVKKIFPKRLLGRTRRLYNIRIGNITFKDEPLRLGCLKGNKFRIALRNVTGNDELIEEAVKSLQEKGFINYYGLQRFGNDKEVPTYSIGIQLLLGNWKEACNLILKVSKAEQEDSDVAKAKRIYKETGDAEKALKAFDGSRNKCVEYLLLAGLKKESKNDFVNALTKIPRNARLLYIHAFQSLIWNLAVSKRIETFGLEPVEGDLVFDDDEDESKIIEEIEDKNLEENINEVPKKGRKVKVLTLEDCSNYTIYDIVMPLPGYDIVYPENMKDFYKECLEKHGLTLEMTKQRVETYTLSGTHRKILGQVKDLSHKIMYYNDPNYNLIRSDLEELKGQSEPQSVQDGKYKALVLEFSLKSSSYATMVLRELLKIDTSSSSHSQLNNYHVEKTEKKEETPESEQFNDKVGLLNDSAKYEAFKNLIFNGEETAPKRKAENTEEEEITPVKVAKV